MVDLCIAVVLSWCVWFGYRRGFWRTCMDAIALLAPMFLLTFSIPFLKGALVDKSWSFALTKWMAGHLVHTSPQSSGFLNVTKATPVGQGLGPDVIAVVERLYDLLLLGLMGGTIFVGLQMILRVYETLWRDERGLWRSKIAGGFVGLGIGTTISTYLVSVLGLVCWLQGLQWIDGELMHSMFVRSLYRLIVW
ncbi:hypothetical protein [Tumebacillus permanentifrigoris]|uniref:Colicin V production protein n=1 Tax=Tumebacillus permanentifrigoris TaxID=378543 RepID=A0A316DEY3_9BACL|nr:hypothetical protein [Tumebacillus permanentifrigoris]PWK16594.1 hypothetical protein C7459_101460 [Tumebacillus permanentifrigoris]